MTLYHFDMSNKEMKPVQETKFQHVHVLENAHLQTAIERHPELMGEGLLIIAKEYGQWAGSMKRIDLLALDKRGNLVVIELKRTCEDRQVDLQAIRYAGMVAVMSRDEIVETYAEYLKKAGKDIDAEEEIKAFLGGTLEEMQLGERVRILMVAQDFQDEVVATVFWLNEQGLDISCLKMTPYQNGKEVLVDISKFIPLPEAREWQEKFKRKEIERKASKGKRDTTRFRIIVGGEVVEEKLPKNRTMLVLMTLLIKKHGITPEQLQKQFDHYTGVDLFSIQNGTVAQYDFIDALEEKKRVRYFTGKDELIYHDNKTIAVSTQWGGELYYAALDVMKQKYSRCFTVTAL